MNTNETENQAPEPEKTPKPKPVKKTVKKVVKKSKKKDTGYGIEYIAKGLDKKKNLVRILLRKKKVKKPGKSYIWTSKAEADAVIKQLKTA